MTNQPQERRFKTSGLEYAAQCWGNTQQPLVVALHGWLDNALSFVKLAPLLSNYRVIAIDLSGHGLSSWRSVDSTYHIWDDLPQLIDVIDALESERYPSTCSQKIALMGHSRGASVATLLACALGERCSSLTLIDGMLPAWGDDQNGAHQVRRFVEQRRKYIQRTDRYFDTIEEFAERRKQFGFTNESGRLLAPRALEQTKSGWRLRSDPRLYGASAVYIDKTQREKIYRQLDTPVLGVIARQGLLTRDGLAQQTLQEARQCLSNYRSTTIEGSHHLHMEADSSVLVAQRIEQFLVTLQ